MITQTRCARYRRRHQYHQHARRNYRRRSSITDDVVISLTPRHYTRVSIKRYGRFLTTRRLLRWWTRRRCVLAVVIRVEEHNHRMLLCDDGRDSCFRASSVDTNLLTSCAWDGRPADFRNRGVVPPRPVDLTETTISKKKYAYTRVRLAGWLAGWPCTKFLLVVVVVVRNNNNNPLVCVYS